MDTAEYFFLLLLPLSLFPFFLFFSCSLDTWYDASSSPSSELLDSSLEEASYVFLSSCFVLAALLFALSSRMRFLYSFLFSFSSCFCCSSFAFLLASLLALLSLFLSFRIGGLVIFEGGITRCGKWHLTAAACILDKHIIIIRLSGGSWSSSSFHTSRGEAYLK